jgi:hypothetical protein
VEVEASFPAWELASAAEASYLLVMREPAVEQRVVLAAMPSPAQVPNWEREHS